MGGTCSSLQSTDEVTEDIYVDRLGPVGKPLYKHRWSYTPAGISLPAPPPRPLQVPGIQLPVIPVSQNNQKNLDNVIKLCGL